MEIEQRIDQYREYRDQLVKKVIGGLDLENGDQYKVVDFYAKHVLGIDDSVVGDWRLVAGLRLNGVGSENMTHDTRSFWSDVQKLIPNALSNTDLTEILDKWWLNNEWIANDIALILDPELRLQVHVNK